MRNNKIYPLAYQLAPGQIQTIYYLGFPEGWKTALLEIARKNNPRLKNEIGLPTETLKKMAESWMEGIVSLGPLKQDSNDERWLACCYELREKELDVLINLIKVWINVTYIAAPKSIPLVRDLASAFCQSITSEDLKPLQSKSSVCLTNENGSVCKEAYQAIPFLAINRLLGKEILLQNTPLKLCYADKNQLISQPIIDESTKHQFSFVFAFSIQTTPPERKALLLCHISIRRWIPGCYRKGKVPFLANSIYAHIKISENKYCSIPISYNAKQRQVDWMRKEKECYTICGYDPLPDAAQVLVSPECYTSRILLPYKEGMNGFKKSKIGTGVSVVDKAALYQSLSEHLTGIIGKAPEACRVNCRGNIAVYQSPQEYASREDFRIWARKCAETSHITFELYGLWSDTVQSALLEEIEDKLFADFGENTPGSCLNITCLHKETGSLANALSGDTKDVKIARCEEIVQQLGSAETVTGVFFVLPGPEHYLTGDPKSVLRNAFARTGRVIQFIVPDSESNSHKIQNTVYDLYRQLGIVALINLEKTPPALAATPCVGMHVFTQIHGISNKARFLPLYVTVNILEGKTRVYCDAFQERTVSYRQACLALAQLFWQCDLEQRCVDASRSPAKQRLIALKNQYSTKENSVLLVVEADGNSRELWSGISDKEIEQYSLVGEYSPSQINVGMPKNPLMFSLQNSGVRIIRMRCNQEVPDYFTGQSKASTEESKKYSTASGIFQFEKVFWSILNKPRDLQYSLSFICSKITCPAKRFAEKDMIELYPFFLQAGDIPTQWIFYVNALRHIQIQYAQSTVLPLPLHLGKDLKEYLFDA